MKLSDKVDIVYNDSHGLSNSSYSRSCINECRKYKVPFNDNRATKKNIEAFIRAKDSGYRKDFTDFCHEGDFADGRKTRNGKGAWENNWRNHILEIGLMCFIIFGALYVYGNTALFLPIVIIVLILWKLLGKRRALLLSFLFFLVYCYFSYHK